MSNLKKMAPVQGFTAGIPWSMHLRAYDAYRKKYGEQKALIDLEGSGCRGGFGVGELDDFIPGWRDEVSEITRLNERLEEARKIVGELMNIAETAMPETYFKSDSRTTRARKFMSADDV